MSLKTIFDFFLIVGVIQGFIFIAISFLIRKKIERTILFLNLFILFLSLNNLNTWFIDKGFLGEDVLVRYMNIPWYVLIVPMFYSFLVHYLGIEDKNWPFFRISAILFLLMLISRFSLVYLVHVESVNDDFLEKYSLIEDALAFAYSIFLYIKSIGLLTRYRRLYPDILVFDDLQWIKQFLKFGGLLFMMWFAAMVLNSFFSFIEPPYTYYPLRLLLSIFIYWVGYQAFYRYVILKERIGLRTKLKDKVVLHSKRLENVKPNLSVFDKIHNHVISQKSYLNPYLGMDTLSEELGMGISTLSKHINKNVEGNFSDYINLFRIEEAKRILIDPDYVGYTIVAIGLECGFNSKSTFYSAFKRHTGLTPVAFRKSYSN